MRRVLALIVVALFCFPLAMVASPADVETRRGAMALGSDLSSVVLFAFEGLSRQLALPFPAASPEPELAVCLRAPPPLDGKCGSASGFRSLRGGASGLTPLRGGTSGLTPLRGDASGLTPLRVDPAFADSSPATGFNLGIGGLASILSLEARLSRASSPPDGSFSCADERPEGLAR